MTTELPKRGLLATELTARLRDQEANRRVQRVPRKVLALMPDGRLRVDGSEPCELRSEASKDLAELARIPWEYFQSVEPRLQAINFRFRMPALPDSDQHVSIVWEGARIARVHDNRLNLTPRHKLLQALIDAAPTEARPSELQTVVYALNGHVDLSLVSPSLKSEPQVGDDVYHGIHLMVEELGAIQVGAVTFRLICRNGAMARVCAEGQHRIRRGRQGDGDVLDAVSRFAASAWRDWGRIAEGLKGLTREHVAPADLPGLLRRLRESPFFISARAARQVERQLSTAGTATPSLYDLHNAITAVGSHAYDVPWRYRFRLRLGAGSLARGRVAVCRECRQMVLGGG